MDYLKICKASNVQRMAHDAHHTTTYDKLQLSDSSGQIIIKYPLINLIKQPIKPISPHVNGE